MSTTLDHYVEAEDFKSKRPSLTVVGKVLRDLSGEKKPFILGALFVVLGTCATLYEPRLFGRAIDQAIIGKNYSLLGRMTVLYFGLILLRVTMMIGQQYAFEILTQSMMQRLRLRIFSLYQRLPIATYDRTPVGRLITRLTNDTSSMSEMFSGGFVTFFSHLLFILGSVIWILVLNWRLALIALSVFPVLLYFSVRFSRRLIDAYRDSRMRISSLNAFMAENILGMKVVHLFNRASLHFGRFQEVNESYAESQVAAIRVYAYFQPLITWCSGAGVALVLLFGGAKVLDAEITPGELVTFISFLLALFQPVREVVDKWTVFLSGMTSAERIYGLMDWETEITESEANQEVLGGRSGLRLQGRIEFENVWFAYEGENWVLRDFSIVIEAGTRVGVVGHTGAGKTTLISLLLRFYDPNRGRILIDGKDLREYGKREIRDRIGIIQQDVFLFSGKISDNASLWRGNQPGSASTREKLEKMGFLKDPETELDERGSNLSMGERQVLAFARAIEKNPDLWVLDEATANIDSDTETRFGLALDHEAKGKTLLMIAHRLATIRKSDLILVMHKGQLVEKGNHQSLLRSGGYYSRLYRYQEAVEAVEKTSPVIP